MGSEFRNKYFEPFYKAELKDAKAKGGDGWEILKPQGSLSCLSATTSLPVLIIFICHLPSSKFAHAL